MAKILAYPLSVIYYLCFGIVLLVFHVIQWICLNLFGYEAHKKSVSILNWFLMRCVNLLGNRYTFKMNENIPDNVPVIIVANHQSLHDIPPIIWHMRKYHPKFISKIELGKGIPSVSFNLRHGGSVLIDRKNSEQALKAIKDFSLYIRNNNYAAVIFPEGTRSKNGKPKRFQISGLKLMFQQIPEAVVVPITINNSWKLFKYGNFPLGIGNNIRFKVHDPIKIDGQDINQLTKEIESIIVNDIK
ncbi:1-acyl-sn-glycerol-3-phosphate acyltransferase [Zhouia spongiae]|uniref:1-acyl-sn-glycerol-3-phosphate acyltransferase n=1 Tax=Zhouia spongiae TaxID=2202721 RepID=A0ABY3YP41_9FLAO|nr:lysophospholipid acyltransferase family protein [Zhouia spongiae]UNY99586.1 1-acyl-sn-glycerol-3-phosphate acyltransferase [Zhouia spongiae]